jgi:membrane protein implicated in regulation of membrane protease activity
MATELLLTWWNLIFIVPFFLALLYLILYSVSGITFGESDADASPDADTDAHVETDLAADADAEADVDADADIGSAADVHPHIDTDMAAHADTATSPHADAPSHSAPFHLVALAALGLGRVPLSILLMMLLISWGVIGFIANVLLLPSVPQGLIPSISLSAAAVGSLLFTSAVSRFIGRFMPLNETYARRRHELLGSVGEALYPIDSTFGMMTVRDDYGDLFDFPCRTSEEQPPIAKGARVRLVGYNARRKLFYVIPEPTREPPK